MNFAMGNFSLQRWLGILVKEFIQLRRDRLTFGMIIGIPIIQLLLFGFAINSDPKHLPTAVVMADPGPFARSYVAAMQNSEYFRLLGDGYGMTAQKAGIFAKFDLNIDAVLQRPGCSKSALPFVITFESCPWSRVEAALAAVSHCDFLQQPPVHMPIIR